MRVTENTNFELVRNNIHRSKERLENLQSQAATLKKINVPGDDPVAAAKLLEIRTEKVDNQQFLTNSKMAESFLTNSDNALSELVDIVVRAKEIALGQSSGASSSEESRFGVVEEVSHLYGQAVAAANRRIGDRYLFGGYKTTTPPVDEEGNYLGDTGQMMIEIGRGVYISMNVPGNEIFNTQPRAQVEQYNDQGRVPASLEDSQGGERENSNIFSELQNLRVALMTGDLGGVQNTLDRFDGLHSRLVSMRSKIGSRLSGLESSHQSMDRHALTNARLTSQLEDADMVQVMTDLAKEESVYRSTLGASKKLMQPTLMDFLK